MPRSPKDARLEIVLAPADKAAFEDAARAEDLTLSQWVRRVCRAAVTKSRNRGRANTTR